MFKFLKVKIIFLKYSKVVGVEEAHILDTNLKWVDPNGEEIIERPGVGK